MADRFFSINNSKKLLNQFLFGIERETLRIDKEGNLSNKKHPQNLGYSLTHPYITKDFGESQLELRTPPFKTFEDTTAYLQNIISFTYKKIKDELFWPLSMPCKIPKIEIAKFGKANEAKNKELYRRGLKYRYGGKVQMVSGIHFNFSFSQNFWRSLHEYELSKLTLKSFITKKYLHLMRNFLREGWIITYLFGCSPAMEASYVKNPGDDLKSIKDVLYSQFATSIRMSKFGYYNYIKQQKSISFNNVNDYVKDLKCAISTTNKDYLHIKSQLNGFFLQNENEFYSRIRPKTIKRDSETILEAIENRGIEYLEIRSIDVDPYHPLGISDDCIHFLHMFIIYCLFKNSPIITASIQKNLTINQNIVALQGRKENLKLLSGKYLKSTGMEILKNISPIASILNYEKVLNNQIEKINHPNLTPSSKILDDIKNYGMKNFALDLAKSHKKFALKQKITNEVMDSFDDDIKQSIISYKFLVARSKVLLNGFESLEISTQILIKEALKRKIGVEVIDWEDNFIKMVKGGDVKYVQQATKTSRDSYIVANILKNKHVTKKILKDSGFSVPISKLYMRLEDAVIDYDLYKGTQVVIKPTKTNCGVGITFLDDFNRHMYERAVKDGFKYGDRKSVV